jgi:hypothetical protein
MEFDRPAVKEVFPMGDNGLHLLPEYLDAINIIDRQELFLYNSFEPGLSLTRTPTQNITYKLLSNHFIKDSGSLLEKSHSGPEELNKVRLLHQISANFWPAAAAYFSRAVKAPKRDNGPNMNVTPDMGITVSPPKRKIDGPKNTQRPGPPTPGGR